VVTALLDFIQTRGLPAAALRVRMALDVAEQDEAGLTASRPTLARVNIDEHGRAHAPACATPDHLATLLWEIVAGRLAESDELPWSDPADDLPPGVLDTFASLTLRAPRDVPELCRRFAAGVCSHAAARDDVRRVLAVELDPDQIGRVTLRVPAVQIEALRTLSVVGASPPKVEDGIVTRVQPVVTPPAPVPPAFAPPAPETMAAHLPRSTMDPWNAPLASSSEPEAEPQRRRTWPIVAACLVAALALLVVAGRQRIATATSTLTDAPASESTARVPAAPIAPSAKAAEAPSAPVAAAPTSSASTSASAPATPSPIAPPPPRSFPRYQAPTPPPQVTAPAHREPSPAVDEAQTEPPAFSPPAEVAPAPSPADPSIL
jgi:hypothetical protein